MYHSPRVCRWLRQGPRLSPRMIFHLRRHVSCFKKILEEEAWDQPRSQRHTGWLFLPFYRSCSHASKVATQTLTVPAISCSCLCRSINCCSMCVGSSSCHSRDGRSKDVTECLGIAHGVVGVTYSTPAACKIGVGSLSSTCLRTPEDLWRISVYFMDCDEIKITGVTRRAHILHPVLESPVKNP